MATANGPLAGVRVVEIGVWVAGPAAGGILADWGADVIKIEPPGGDPARSFQRMLGGDMPTNPPFELDNRSKRSVVLDLSEPEGRERALALVDTADVFVTNIRASALARLGFDADTLLGRNERLVYALITGYGTSGPDADRPAYDIAAYLGPVRARSRADTSRRATPVPTRGHGRPQRRDDGGRHGERRAVRA